MSVGGYAAVVLVFGIGFAAMGLVIAVSGAFIVAEDVGGIVAVVMGLLSTGLGVFLLAIWWRSRGNNRLVVDSGGITLDHTKRQRFQVAWREVGAVGLSWFERSRPRTPYIVHRFCLVDLYPADSGFRARHPEMEQYWGVGGIEEGYRVTFGTGNHLNVLDAAFRRLVPRLYLGVGPAAFTGRRAEATPQPGQAGAAQQATTIDVGVFSRAARFVGGGTLLGALGIGFVPITVIFFVARGATSPAGWVFLASTVVLLAAAVFLVASFARMRTRTRATLTVDRAGLRYRGSGDRAFDLTWAELGGVGISWTRSGWLYPTRFAYLELFLADLRSRAAHPEMERWWRQQGPRAGYRLLLGVEDTAAEVDRAVRHYCPRRYLGVRT